MLRSIGVVFVLLAFIVLGACFTQANARNGELEMRVHHVEAELVEMQRAMRLMAKEIAQQ